MIKIGANYLSIRELTVEEFIRTAYELKLDIVDFHKGAFTSTDPDYLGSIKYQCLKYGLPIGYIGVSGYFVGTEENVRATAQECKEAIDLAAFLGSPIIRVFCATVPEKDADGNDPWPAMIAGYQEAADYAATKGIAVGLQNHPSTGDEMLRIRRETDRKNFNFIMDTGQWVGSPGAAPRKGRTALSGDSNIDFYQFMEQTLPHAMYIRTKFYEISSGKEEWLDYDRIVPLLKNSNYNGCISIVYEGEDENHREQVRLAAAYLRDLLSGH